MIQCQTVSELASQNSQINANFVPICSNKILLSGINLKSMRIIGLDDVINEVLSLFLMS